jgi:hypothetical protein
VKLIAEAIVTALGALWYVDAGRVHREDVPRVDLFYASLLQLAQLGRAIVRAPYKYALVLQITFRVNCKMFNF